MSPEVDARLARLKTELDDHAQIAHYLGLDFERPIRSIGDGYPENAVALVGKITERLLKQLWRHHNVPGTPAGKQLKDLISGCRPYIRSHRVVESLHDIQRLRNRSAHDGYVVADEDGLTAVRRLLDVLAWYTSTGSGALSEHAPKLAPAVAAKAEFLAGLYVTLDYKPVKRFELSRHTVYQLFMRERGLRSEYIELLLSRDAEDVATVLQATGGQLLDTQLPKLTRFLVLEDEASGPVPDGLRSDYRVVGYEEFMGTFVDVDRHLADVTSLYPRLDAAVLPVMGDLLTADEQSGEMTVISDGAAVVLLDRVAAAGGNLLIVGRPGSGKTTLLKQLVRCGAGGGDTAVPVLLRPQPEGPRGAVRGLRHPDARSVHVGGVRVRVPRVLLLRPSRVGAVRAGRFRRGRAGADSGRIPGVVQRGRRGAVGGVGSGDDLAGVVPGGLAAGAAAARWHQPRVGEAGPGAARPGRGPAAGAPVLGVAAARRCGGAVAAGPAAGRDAV